MSNIFYKNQFVTLYCGDCIEVLEELSGPFNLLVADPPYSFVKKNETWDQCSHSDLESIIRKLFELINPKFQKNGAVYCFCWPYFSARLQYIMADYFNVLNEIVWMKRRASGAQCGQQAKASLEKLRKYFPETERIVFAEMSGSDKKALSDSEYGKYSDQLWCEIMQPLISYFKEAKRQSGLSGKDIQEKMFQLTGKRYVFAQHAFSESQWEFPTFEQYSAAEKFMPMLRGQYNNLRGQYNNLREQYNNLRRAHYPQRNNFTDLWIYSPIMAGSKQRLHSCQKPLNMIVDMINTSSRPGDIVLDPFAGAGTTGVAAIKTGRQAILIEKEEKYCEIAVKRIEQESTDFFDIN